MGLAETQWLHVHDRATRAADRHGSWDCECGDVLHVRKARPAGQAPRVVIAWTADLARPAPGPGGGLAGRVNLRRGRRVLQLNPVARRRASGGIPFAHHAKAVAYEPDPHRPNADHHCRPRLPGWLVRVIVPGCRAVGAGCVCPPWLPLWWPP